MGDTSTRSLPADFFVTSHQFTRTTHREQYASIDPSRPDLSQAAKSVVITGATQGIGKAIAIAFAKAKAAQIILVSRNIDKLEETKRELLKANPDIDVLVSPTDITSEVQVARLEELVRTQLGIPDVLVNSAGSWSSVENIGESKPAEWWTDFEVNVKGTYLVSRAFLRMVGSEKEATIVNVGSWGMTTTSAVGSSYFISKLALGRLSESIPVGYPNVCSISFHPGMAVTEMAHSHPEVLPFCQDKLDLPAGVAVYLASPAARFLNGRYMSANWDVDELEARRAEIVDKNLLKIGLEGEFGSQYFN